MMQTKPSRIKLDTEEQVYAYAMNLLNFRDYGGKDMLQRLQAKGASEENAVKAVARLMANGFVEERRYAQQVFRSWLNKKVYGRLHLKMELRNKNVSEDLIPELLEEFTDELEMENALRAAKQFLQRNAKKIKAGGKGMLPAAARFMTNRGFSSKYIQVLLEQIRAENDM